MAFPDKSAGFPLFHVKTEIPCAKNIGRHLFSGGEAGRGSDQIGDAVDNRRASQLDGCRSVDDDLGVGLPLMVQTF